MSLLAVSSWSVRHALGPMYPGLAHTSGERRPDHTFGTGSLTLLDLPDAARAAGIDALDLCHFHFPRTDAAYLQEFHARLTAANMRVLSLLIDDGDISAADSMQRERDLAYIRDWINIAAQLGSRYVRVIAGQQEASSDGHTIQRSAEGLSTLAHYALAQSVGLLTENWRSLAMSPDNLLAILDAAGGTVGLCADFGNYRGPEKYRNLAAILPRASTIHAHAKAEWMRPDAADRGDLARCLDLAQEAGFLGPYVLIFDGDAVGDEWNGIMQMATIVRQHT